MRVLLFVYEYPPLGGGVANAIFHLLHEWKKDTDLTIDVVTSSLQNQWETEQFSERITFYKVPIGVRTPENYHRQTLQHMVRYTLGSLWLGVRLSQKSSYDVSLTFGYPGPVASWVLSWFGIPYVVALRGVDVPGYNPRFSWGSWIHRCIMRILWSRAQRMTANSQWLATLAQKTWSQAHMAVIPNGVDTDLFQPLPLKDRYTAFTVTAGGTVMGKKKRLDVLIRGFAEFVKDQKLSASEAQLLLIGDGDEYQSLVRLTQDLDIEKYVRFVGAKDKEWIANNLPRCHVFCLPSVAEGMSNAALEAMACGLPLILSDVGAAREMVGENGVILEQVNTKNISKAIQTIYKNRQLRVQYDVSDWSVIAEKYKKEVLA